MTGSSDQLSAFGSCVFADHDIVEVRRLPSGHSTWHRAAELAGEAETLTGENANRENMLAGANPRTKVGGRCGGKNGNRFRRYNNDPH